MAVYSINKVLSMPASPAPDAVYYVKGVADSRAKLYISDSTGTAYPVGILTEGDVISSLLSGYSVGSDIALSSSDTILQAFQKVQGQLNALSTSVSQGMKVPLPLDCSGNPDYPSADAGDSYKVTVAGRIGGASGPLVQNGDVITALTTNGGGTEAAVGSQWFILQANTDNATELVTGLTRIATSAEVSAGSEAFAYVTPLTLNGKLVSELAGYVTLDTSQTITGIKTFDSFNLLPRYDIEATADMDDLYTPAKVSAGIVFNGAGNLPTAETGNWRYGTLGSFSLVTRDNADNEIYIRKAYSPASSFNDWKKLAFQDWVTSNFEGVGKTIGIGLGNGYTFNNAEDAMDLDSIATSTAIRHNSNNTNAPITNVGTSLTLTNGAGAASVAYQFYLGHSLGDAFYYRGKSGGVYSDWKRVASREWVTEQDYQAAGNYVTTDAENGATTTNFTGDINTTLRNSIYFASGSSTNLPKSGNHTVFQAGNSSDSDGFRLIGSTFHDDSLFFQRRNTSTWHATQYQVASREWTSNQFVSLSVDENIAGKKIFDKAVVLNTTGSFADADVFTDFYTETNRGLSFTNISGGSNYPLSVGLLVNLFGNNSNGTSDRMMQLFMSKDADEWYLRRIKANASDGFRKIWHSGNFDPSNYQTALTNPVTGTGAAGRIAYWSSTGVLTSNGGLLYDGSKLGLGFDTGIRGASGGLVISADANSSNKIILRTDGDGDVTGQIEVLSNEFRTSTGTFTLRSNQGNGHIHLRPHGEGQVEVYSNFRIYKDGVPEFRIGGNGNVAAPKVILAAAGSGGRTWTMQSGNSTNGVSSALSFSETSVPNLLVLNSTAKVGINTDSPTDTLDINGSARIRTMSIAAGDYFVMATGTGVLRRITPAVTLTLIGAQAARSITSPTGSISITGGAAGSTSTELEMQWGAAEW